MTMKFKSRGEKEIEVEVILSLNIGSLVSAKATKATLMAHLDCIINAAFYFNNMLTSSEVTKEDGRAIGGALMLATKEKTKSKDDVVREFVKLNKTLGELTTRYEFVETMLIAIVKNKLTSLTKYVRGKAEVLSGTEGRLVGRSLAMSLATTLTPSAAVDEVRKKKARILTDRCGNSHPSS